MVSLMMLPGPTFFFMIMSYMLLSNNLTPPELFTFLLIMYHALPYPHSLCLQQREHPILLLWHHHIFFLHRHPRHPHCHCHHHHSILLIIFSHNIIFLLSLCWRQRESLPLLRKPSLPCLQQKEHQSQLHLHPDPSAQQVTNLLIVLLFSLTTICSQHS